MFIHLAKVSHQEYWSQYIDNLIMTLRAAAFAFSLNMQWRRRTALMLASVGGHLDVVRELLKAQADVNAQDEVCSLQ